jgi:hypothetical protein
MIGTCLAIALVPESVTVWTTAVVTAMTATETDREIEFVTGIETGAIVLVIVPATATG